jgi:pyruvate, water dikinase
VVEGRAVVVTDPGESDLDDGDILIAHTTDPSWVSLMFLSAGLVVDIGGLMSHAAVVARELGVPCIMNTGRGTSLIETGDIIRIDGGTGCVEILSRKASAVS